MAEHLQPAPPAEGGWRQGQRGPVSRPAPRRTGREGADAQAAKIKITWHGERITRVVFPSGTTVEFLA
ncbi:MAG TPA: hypothetical protein GXX28_04880 [Firmicutes bacterium]|nr:hypothetical protein [Bacillota bacterium]